jgi:hypothetical protein
MGVVRGYPLRTDARWPPEPVRKHNVVCRSSAYTLAIIWHALAEARSGLHTKQEAAAELSVVRTRRCGGYFWILYLSASPCHVDPGRALVNGGSRYIRVSWHLGVRDCPEHSCWGTGLPQIATFIATGLTGQHDIAVGNVVGNKIFNILAVLGIVAAVSTEGHAGFRSGNRG